MLLIFPSLEGFLFNKVINIQVVIPVTIEIPVYSSFILFISKIVALSSRTWFFLLFCGGFFCGLGCCFFSFVALPTQYNDLKYRDHQRWQLRLLRVLCINLLCKQVDCNPWRVCWRVISHNFTMLSRFCFNLSFMTIVSEISFEWGSVWIVFYHLQYHHQLFLFKSQKLLCFFLLQ